MPARDVAIVIPTWNGRQLLEEFLPSVERAAERYRGSSAAAIEIVIVDDGSTDDTRQWLSERQKTATVLLRTVHLDVNRGFAAACNRGVTEAQFGLVLLLNNDVHIAPDAIAPLVAHFDDPQLFAVHCRSVDATTGRPAGMAQAGAFRRGFLRVHDRYEPSPAAPGPFASVFAGGGAAMFDRARFLELGGFDPLFAPFYYEDVELSYRAWKRGLEVRYEPAAIVRHRFSSTIGASGRRRIQRISQRNRLLFHWIHLHDRRWLLSHLVWVPAVAVARLLSLRPHAALGVVDALRRLGDVRQRRRRERAAAVRSDRDVIERTKKRPA